MKKISFLLVLWGLLGSSVLSAQEERLEIFVDFRVDTTYIDPDYGNDAQRLAQITDFLQGMQNDPTVGLFYMAVKTNLLYDVLFIPNVGVEFYLGKAWSVAGNWQYAWWSNDHKHNYWRVYGGDIALRKWFGSKAKEKPLTGHHLGIYAQTLTYDFERDGRGYMGGEPGGNIFERANYAVGIEYGYSYPIGRRLNLDFTLGIGYGWGEYYEYLPIDDCYVWQTTKNRRWLGPTKAEVSLVWLLGKYNENQKGGKR